MFLVQRPPAPVIERFLSDCAGLPLSYDPIGLARTGREGFALDEHVAILGAGEAAFASATKALGDWRHFDLGWVEIFPARAAIEPGTVLAVLVRHVGFWSLNGCRVVYSVGATSGFEFGFAYGTLTNHGECGEEIFLVNYQAATGEVTYRIRAVSRPRAPLARLGYPLTRLLQARFRRDSAAAMTRAVAGVLPSSAYTPRP
jgi:uncharacterized protein (UPF0548 family)